MLLPRAMLVSRLYAPPTGPSYTPVNPPLGARVASVLIDIVTIMILQHCLSERWPSLKTARSQPIVSWLNLALYIDSLLFTISQMLLRFAWGENSSFTTCSIAVMFCLSFYLSSKLLIYFYFTERSFLVWASRNSRNGTRTTNRLYLFNMTVIIGGYIVVIVMTFIYRISYLADNGFCIIGLERRISIPLTAYEMAINIYLTSLFLWPLRKVYSYKHKNSAQLRQMTIRCLIGTFGTCISTGANLTAVSIIDGEQGWLCLMCCNLDLVVCVVILHWVTSYGEKNKTQSGSTPVQGSRVESRKLPYGSGTRGMASPTLPSGGNERTWESIVTTSITHEDPESPPDPNGITVQMQQSQKYEEMQDLSEKSDEFDNPRTSKHDWTVTTTISPTADAPEGPAKPEDAVVTVSRQRSSRDGRRSSRHSAQSPPRNKFRPKFLKRSPSCTNPTIEQEATDEE